MQLIPYTYNELSQMAQTIAKSGLFGVRSPDQALALMLISQAEGISPALAARDYHVIQGRPTLKSDAMVARFQAAGGKIEWREYTEQSVSALFTHTAGGSIEVKWTIEMAKRAGLTGKDVWRQYPRAMLRARVVSEGIRTVYPGVCVGVYTPEEVEQFEARPDHVESVVSNTVSGAPFQVTDGKGNKLTLKDKSVEHGVELEVVTSEAEIVTQFSDIEKEAISYLIYRNRLAEGQTLSDVPAETLKMISERPDAFRKMVLQFAKESK